PSRNFKTDKTPWKDTLHQIIPKGPHSLVHYIVHVLIDRRSFMRRARQTASPGKSEINGTNPWKDWNFIFRSSHNHMNRWENLILESAYGSQLGSVQIRLEPT
ncbi:20042_t:CDS:2, partial [Rhizophagus irregularis]